MKIYKIIISMLLCFSFCMMNFTSALAYTYSDERFIINLDISDDYIIYNSESQVTSDDELSDRISQRLENGVIIDAVNPVSQIELTVYTATDRLSESIKNYTLVDENNRKTFESKYKSELSKNGHTFLCEPGNVTVDGYEFIRILARVGSSTDGYSYLSYVTVVGGDFYEVTAYMPQAIPTEKEIADSEQILKTFQIDVLGLKDSLNQNSISQVVTTLVIVVCALVMSFIIILGAKSLLSGKKHKRKKAVSSNENRS